MKHGYTKWKMRQEHTYLVVLLQETLFTDMD